MGKITYTNKVALNENPEVADINKITDDDMNEIKSVVNTNDDNVGDITTLTTTTKTSTVSAINELNSTKATSNDVGNIANLTTTDKTNVVNAVNELNSNKASKNEVIISDTQPSANDNKIWIDTGEVSSSGYENRYSTTEETIVGLWNGKPLYRKVFTGTFDGSGSGSSTSTYVHEILPSTCDIKNSCGNATQPGSGQNKRPFNFMFIYQGTTGYISCNFAKNSAYNYSWTMGFWYSADYAGQTYEIAIEYTKDTD